VVRVAGVNLVTALAGLLVLLAYGPFTPAASASCGDHVRLDTDVPARDQAPCTGPTCGQSKDVPPVPPAPTPEQRDDRLAALDAAPTTQPTTSAYLDDNSPRPHAGQTQSIFHPPRA